MITININDWKFMEVLDEGFRSLTEISLKLKLELSNVQKIYNKLNSWGILDQKKEGKIRYIWLNQTGLYFLSFYKKIKRRVKWK